MSKSNYLLNENLYNILFNDFIIIIDYILLNKVYKRDKTISYTKDFFKIYI